MIEQMGSFIYETAGTILGLIATLSLMSVFFYIVSSKLLKQETAVPAGESINFAPAHDPKDFFVQDNKFEWVYPLVNNTITKPIEALVFGGAFWFLSQYFEYQMFTDVITQLPFLVQIVLALFIWDMCLYVRHRFVHEFMWSFHGVHHCAKKINWMTTTRVHPVDVFVMGFINFAMLYFIGFNAETFIYAITINGYWNYFVHMNICLDFPKPFKYIFGSPNFHRWHHANNIPEAHNKNYCIMFSCIDYVMGTYYLPDNKLPEEYGCSLKKLDDIDNKTVWIELWYPVQRQINKIRKKLQKPNLKTDP